MGSFDRLLKLGELTEFDDFFLPIVDKDITKEVEGILKNKETKQEKIMLLEEKIAKGKILRATITGLGLPILLYFDDKEKFLEEPKEFCIEYGKNPDSKTTMSLNEIQNILEEGDISFFNDEVMKPVNREVMIEGIEIDEFRCIDPKITNCYFSATRSAVSDHTDNEFTLSYYTKMSKELKIKTISVLLNFRTKEKKNLDIMVSAAKVDKEQEDVYKKHARIILPSNSEQNYVFDFEDNGLLNSVSFGSNKLNEEEFVNALFELEKNPFLNYEQAKTNKINYDIALLGLMLPTSTLEFTGHTFFKSVSEDYVNLVVNSEV